MNINFTGIKNIGYLNECFNDQAYRVLGECDGYAYEDDADEDVDYPVYEKQEGHLLNIQLTDDYNGKHLSAYKKALQKAELSAKEYENPINKNFLNIYISDDIIQEEHSKYTENEILINNKEVALNDKTLPFFSYLAQLIREIAQKPEKDFIVNKDYIDSDDAKLGITIGNNMEEIFKEDYQEVLKDTLDPENVKEGAKMMDNVIMKFMQKYFEN